jgi:hypothetical protein
MHLPSIVNVHLILTGSLAYAVIEFVYRLYWDKLTLKVCVLKY